MKKSSLSCIRHLVKDTMSISGLLQIQSFSHVRKEGNVVTHALVQRVRLSFPSCVWTKDVPLDILHFVIDDFLAYGPFGLRGKEGE